MVMILIYALIALFIAWIWVDYFRLIDLFEPESLKFFIITFILGCLSVFIVLGLEQYVFNNFAFELNGEFINDFAYSVLMIGMVEELAKVIPFLVVYLLFKSQINEPIDYVAYICVSALGFSAVENVMYFNSEGPSVINGRAALASVGHMFDTALIAYGIIRYKFHPSKPSRISIVFFFLLAALSHGFYDFWLIHNFTGFSGWIVTVLYFFITISWFAVIINNAINNSPFFSYKKVVDPNKVAGRLLSYYLVVFLIQFVLLSLTEGLEYAAYNLIGELFFTGLIVMVICGRLSRFKLIEKRWNNLTLEFPFSLKPGNSHYSDAGFLRLRIKGESFNEVHITKFYQEYFYLKPLTKRKTYLGQPRLAYIEKKIFLHNDESYFMARVYAEDQNGQFEQILLKPKTRGKTIVHGKHPLVAVLKYDHIKNVEDPKLKVKNFKYKEWAFIKPRKRTPR